MLLKWFCKPGFPIFLMFLFLGSFLFLASNAPAAWSDSMSFTSREPKWVYKAVGTVNVVSVSPNGSSLLVGTSENFLYVFYNVSSSMPSTIISLQYPPTEIVFSDDSKYVAILNSTYFELLNFTKGDLDATWNFTAGNYQISSFAFSADGNSVVVGTSDGWVRLFETVHGRQVWAMMVSNPGRVSDSISLSISADGNFVVAGSQVGHAVFLIDNGSLVYSYDKTDPVVGVAVSNDGRYFVAATSNEIHYFDKSLIAPLWNQQFSQGIRAVTAANNLNEIFVLGNKFMTLLRNNDTQIWTEDWRQSLGYYDNINQAFLSSDETVCGLRTGTKVIKRSSGGLEGYDAKNPISSISMSSDGSFFAAASVDQVLFFSSSANSSFGLSVDPTIIWGVGAIVIVVVLLVIIRRIFRSRARRRGTQIYNTSGASSSFSVRLPSGELRCSNCGFVNRPKSKFCKNCGMQL
jgi:WD40 repeat protein